MGTRWVVSGNGALKLTQWIERTICTKLDVVWMLKYLGGGKVMDVAYGGGQIIMINLHYLYHPL